MDGKGKEKGRKKEGKRKEKGGKRKEKGGKRKGKGINILWRYGGTKNGKQNNL